VGWHVSEPGRRSTGPGPRGEGTIPRIIKSGTATFSMLLKRGAGRAIVLTSAQESRRLPRPLGQTRAAECSSGYAPHLTRRNAKGAVERVAGLSNASTTSLAVGRFASCDCLSRSFSRRGFKCLYGCRRVRRAPYGVLRSAGCRWALWLGWGRGFSSSAAGFRQLVKFFEVY